MEFANVILLNKTDLVPKERVREIKAIIRSLNPGAKFFETCHSKIDLNEIINTGLFNFEEAQKSPGWLQSVQGNAPLIPESEEYGFFLIFFFPLQF